jgi:hypothetical protein
VDAQGTLQLEAPEAPDGQELSDEEIESAVAEVRSDDKEPEPPNPDNEG